MKITRARFENFAHLESGMHKTIIDIDFSDMKNVITLLIGPMGSGKTALLGHLQPWASFGLLDERNSDNIIIPGKDGCKSLEISDGDDKYVVKHIWKWSKDHHTLKSYISKNGEELNPNGNVSSFKDMVEMELGIDQNYLRLIRIGPNVGNIITLTSTERKNYFAQMLSSTEIYLSILKYVKELSRTITAQSQLLSKKIGNVTEDDIDNMRLDLEQTRRNINRKSAELQSVTEKIYKLKAENDVLTMGCADMAQFELLIEKESHHLRKLSDEIDLTHERIQKLEGEYGNDKSINREVGKCDSDLANNARLISSFESNILDLNDKIAKLRKMKLSCSNSSHIDELRRMYIEYIDTINQLKEELRNFKCPYTTTEIKMLMSDLQTVSQLIANAIDYDAGSIKMMISDDGSALSYAKSQIGILQGKLIKLQKELNNVGFIQQYDVADKLKEPTCGCHMECPYYTTHPNTIKAVSSSLEISKEYDEINNKIDSINKKIEGYLQYPTIYSVVKKARYAFNETLPKIKKLGICINDSFYKILTNGTNRVWYDVDELTHILDKCDKRERLAVMESKIASIKAEIDMYDSNNVDEINRQLEECELQLSGVKMNIEKLEDANRDIRSHRAELEEYLAQLINIDTIKVKFDDLIRERNALLEKISEMNKNKSIIENNMRMLADLNERYQTINMELSVLTDNGATLSRKIEDYSQTMVELNGMLNKLNYINLIRDASSPKEGIPLIYVKMFLDDCVDTINEMVSMVFDDLEILEFDIEHDFAIPYRKGNMIMDDIKSASQGERAIISLALSFALMRKGISKYNILLLDEVDGPLHAASREQFLLILSQHIRAIGAEQVFLITHNNCFEGYPVNIIATGDDVIDMNCPLIRLV